ncbi:uncharacterized protein DEA37_0007846 [Paragonimus westermani]|uniref:Uncharacterized protein n=1 Tax=Paragonimus westermani TaxID=34504 RepID=A0A5J4NXA5_9TREM|nr:uncharacterized protein DEA37_0007846 [Paragonimus westermani]
MYVGLSTFVLGIWIGLIVGSSVQIATLLFVCFRMNWSKQVELTKKRLRTEELRNEISLNVTEETDVSRKLLKLVHSINNQEFFHSFHSTNLKFKSPAT